MTILQVNKHYYYRDGTSIFMLNFSELLEKYGHRVVPFSMKQPENLPSPYSHSFVSQVKAERVRFDWQGLRTALRILYSFEARRKLSRLLALTKPDVAHIHNIYNHISPSIFASLKKMNVPVVMTVHDWALLSPNYSLFDHGKVCERGVGNPWGVVSHKCIKDSIVASAWAAFVFWVHDRFQLYKRGVDRFIAPAEFVKEKLIASGFSEDRITVIPHFFDATNIEPVFDGEYIGYIGRLSVEKGVDVLLRAAAKNPDIPVKIAGTGPDEVRLRTFSKELGLKNVEFLGWLDGVRRDRFYRNAIAIVVPSVWYEIFGMIVLESYAFGTPVIASNIGALPEVVREGKTGYLFRPSDSDELAEHMQHLAKHTEIRQRMGSAARALVEAEYNPDLHYKRMIAAYQSVL